MEMADNIVLDMVEGEVLGTRMIEELLALVDQGEADNTAYLMADRNRLEREIANLIQSIKQGVPAETVAPEIRRCEAEKAGVETRLRAPRPQRPNIDRLREALTLRAQQWRETLRTEPKMARVLIRRLISPLELYDASKPEWQMPDFIKADATVKTGLIDGLAEIHEVASPAAIARQVSAIHEVASLMLTSWNQIVSWLRQIQALRRAA